MKLRAPLDYGVFYRVLLIGAAVVVMVLLIQAIIAALNLRGERSMAIPVAERGITGEPIASEAHVFRTRPGDLALDSIGPRRTAAHRRTLAMYRTLRAYPGAPPRIPHGLTTEELRATGCNTCHERGGYVARFAAYTPVTPHPEYADCLQCHVADASIVGVSFPDPRPDAVCLQCHRPDTPSPRVELPGWRAAAWPATGQRALEGSPPPIPHELQLRGNCLACHMGPGAVEEIRTTHPERADCRQCHVRAPEEDELFSRPVNGSRTVFGGGP